MTRSFHNGSVYKVSFEIVFIFNFRVEIFKFYHNPNSHTKKLVKMDFEVNEASQMTLSKFKLRAALKLCIDLFFAEWCWTLFSSTNSIINRSSRYFTSLKLKIRKETFTDQIHRDAYLSSKENFRIFHGIDKSNSV